MMCPSRTPRRRRQSPPAPRPAASALCHVSHATKLVRFLHPRDGREFGAEVGPNVTGFACITELLRHGFIVPLEVPLSYLLARRNGRRIPLQMEFDSVAIEDGEVLIVEIHDPSS